MTPRDENEIDGLLNDESNVAKLSDIEAAGQLDERVSIVNRAFVNLIGMNRGYVEFCPNESPPSMDERLAWLWLRRPSLSRSILDRCRNALFAQLVAAHSATTHG
jgi:hypothetical protein